jgi:hypothetical protein
MIVQCCVCGKNMGEKEPLHDKSITHTYCDSCADEETKKMYEKREGN